MKNKIVNYFSLLLLIAFLGNGCKKDTDFDQIKVPSVQGEQFKQYSWSDQEQQFFSLEKRNFHFAGPRSTNPVVYHPLVIEAYNEIALQNENANFVDSMVVRTGLPLWQQSYVYAHEETNQNLVLIPLGFPNQTHLTGVIAVHKKDGVEAGQYLINGMSRKELLNTETGSPHQKRALAKWMVDYQSWLFETTDEELEEAFCIFNTDPKINGDPEADPTATCVWLILQLCSDDATQTSWIGGQEHLPLHLDHDRDGIPNSEDQDWGEFTNRTGISQEEFREYVETWWEENYEEDYGEYPNFWEEIYDDFNDPSGGGFWNFFDDIWDGFWGWIDDIFDDWGRGGYGDDLYYDPDYINCPWDDPINPKAEDRGIRCDWYYVLDCGGEGDDWWEIFSEIVPCPECPGFQEYQNMLRDRLYGYWDENKNGYLKISFEDLSNLVGNSCDAFSPGFNACVKEIYDAYRLQRITGFIEDFRLDVSVQTLVEAAADCSLSGDFSACLSEAYLRGVFLRSYPEISLSPEQEDWLMDHPDKIGEIMGFMEENNDVDQALLAEVVQNLISIGSTNDSDNYNFGTFIVFDLMQSSGLSGSEALEQASQFLNEFILDLDHTEPSPIPESYYNYQTPIDMNNAPEGSPLNALQFKRNSIWYWNQRLTSTPEMISPNNQWKINNGLSPIVDDTWIDHNPSHRSFKGDVLHHHHVDQANMAVALPKTVHQKWSRYLHEVVKGGRKGLEGFSNIKGFVNGMNKGLGIAGIILDLRGAMNGDPHSLWVQFQPLSGQAQLGQVYYDDNSNTYIVANWMGEWDTPPASGPHKGWKRGVHIAQYVDYAWDSEVERYIGVGLLAKGYQIIYADGTYENIIKECFGDSVDCLRM